MIQFDSGLCRRFLGGTFDGFFSRMIDILGTLIENGPGRCRLMPTLHLRSRHLGHRLIHPDLLSVVQSESETKPECRHHEKSENEQFFPAENEKFLALLHLAPFCARVGGLSNVWVPIGPVFVTIQGMKLKSRDRPDRSGQGLSEYIILVMLIAVCSIAASRMVGSTIKTKLDTINQKLMEIHIP
jgi:hypothetical protein